MRPRSRPRENAAIADEISANSSSPVQISCWSPKGTLNCPARTARLRRNRHCTKASLSIGDSAKSICNRYSNRDDTACPSKMISACSNEKPEVSGSTCVGRSLLGQPPLIEGLQAQVGTEQEATAGGADGEPFVAEPDHPPPRAPRRRSRAASWRSFFCAAARPARRAAGECRRRRHAGARAPASVRRSSITCASRSCAARWAAPAWASARATASAGEAAGDGAGAAPAGEAPAGEAAAGEAAAGEPVGAAAAGALTGRGFAGSAAWTAPPSSMTSPPSAATGARPWVTITAVCVVWPR